MYIARNLPKKAYISQATADCEGGLLKRRLSPEVLLLRCSPGLPNSAGMRRCSMRISSGLRVFLMASTVVGGNAPVSSRCSAARAGAALVEVCRVSSAPGSTAGAAPCNHKQSLRRRPGKHTQEACYAYVLTSSEAPQKSSGWSKFARINSIAPSISPPPITHARLSMRRGTPCSINASYPAP